MILSSIINNPVIALIVLVLFFALVALVVFLLRKYVKFFKTPEVKVDKETAVREDLDRVLVKVEDEKTKEEMEKFHEEEKKK